MWWLQAAADALLREQERRNQEVDVNDIIKRAEARMASAIGAMPPRPAPPAAAQAPPPPCAHMKSETAVERKLMPATSMSLADTHASLSTARMHPNRIQGRQIRAHTVVYAHTCAYHASYFHCARKAPCATG